MEVPKHSSEIWVQEGRSDRRMEKVLNEALRDLYPLTLGD